MRLASSCGTVALACVAPQRAAVQRCKKFLKTATLPTESPLFRIFTIEDCNGFHISVGTVRDHLRDRLRTRGGPGGSRWQNGTAAGPASGRRGGQRKAGRILPGRCSITRKRRRKTLHGRMKKVMSRKRPQSLGGAAPIARSHPKNVLASVAKQSHQSTDSERQRMSPLFQSAYRIWDSS